MAIDKKIPTSFDSSHMTEEDFKRFWSKLDSNKLPNPFHNPLKTIFKSVKNTPVSNLSYADVKCKGSAVAASATDEGRVGAHAATCPPLANRGGKVNPNSNSNFSGVTRYSHVVLNNKGQLVEIPLRRGRNDSAFIDQITFTIDLKSLYDWAIIKFNNDTELAETASMLMNEIFGFGIWRKAEGTGGRFYEQCWLMGSPEVNYGRVHFGGQKNTIMFELTGTGCNAANDDWEIRLHSFLSLCFRAKITRVDLTHDFLDGEYTPEQAFQDWQNDLYTSAYRRPVCEKVGPDWESGTKKGKTFYVGSRQSSRLVRVYEKGKAFGDTTSAWVRAEIEMKSKDIIIPLDVLLHAGEYFCGSYPVFEFIKSTPKRVESIEKNLFITFDQVVHFGRQQVGRAINAVKSMYEGITDSEIVEMFRNQEGLLPRRLNPAHFSASFAETEYIHEYSFEDNTNFSVV